MRTALKRGWALELSVLLLRGVGWGDATLHGRIQPGKREDLQRYTKTDRSRGTRPWSSRPWTRGFPTASKLVTGMFRTCNSWCCLLLLLRVCVVIYFVLLVWKYDALYSRGVMIANWDLDEALRVVEPIVGWKNFMLNFCAAVSSAVRSACVAMEFPI